MPAGLLEQLHGRVTFVVGKGGVGKTTVAGGLALHLADHGTRTHLLSTDPAHSLGDLFGATLKSAPALSPCTDSLLLEELDAAAFADARLRSLAPGLRELIDRGTYLDVEDANALLDAALPGLDEVGAALRIAALTGTRLVIDTAPTGHTLRLLRTPDVVRSWLHVFEAMASKADAVASALVGERVRMSGEADLELLAEEMAAFEGTVAGADFLVVTGPGEVEAAETRRLIAALEERELRVAAVVATDRGRPAADFLLPHQPGLAGCKGLRLWWDGSAAGQTAARQTAPGEAVSRESRGAREVTALEPELSGAFPPELNRPLVVFAGKGGVGKSTCAVATAVRLAEVERVLLMGADPAGSLHDILDGEAVEGLDVREVDGDAELDRFRSLYQTEVESEEYSPDALERNCADVEWMAVQGLSHEQVVAWFVDHASILPSRLLTLFSGEASVRAMLERESDRIRAELDRLAGLREWDLRVGHDPQRLLEHLGEISEEVARLDREIETAGPGKRFLLEKKRKDLARTEGRDAARRLARDLLDSLRPHPREVLSIDPPADATPSTLNAAFLVDADGEAALGDGVAGARERLEPLGLTITMTGPWAPYRFMHENG